MTRCRPHLRTVALLALAVAAFGCSSSPPSSDLSVDSGGRGEALPDRSRLLDVTRDATPPRPAACLEQDQKLQAALDAARTSPNAMLVVWNTACGNTVYASGDPSSGSALSLWRVGSVSKTYVAATILSLIRGGKLSLTDLLSKWIPSVPHTDGVTLKMLLNHTSGIPDYVDDPALAQDPAKIWTPEELVALAAKRPPYSAPGAAWHYSNTNYILLGMIIEKTAAAKVSAVIRARALQPAGLQHTFLEGEEPLQGDLAKGFDAQKNDMTYRWNMSGIWTSGAMVATGADLCQWIAALYGSTAVLSEAELQTMLEGVDVGDGVKYGLGVEILDRSITGNAGPAMGHSGETFGVVTQALFFPEKQAAICAVVNQEGVDPGPVMGAALRALFGP
jgi:D-alanyl-D-alanine carboxypeptidase